MTGASGPSAGDAERFEEIYRAAAGLPAATPWDIGGAQPVVRRLVALGAIKGAVLDPGDRPGPPCRPLRRTRLRGDRSRRVGDGDRRGPRQRPAAPPRIREIAQRLAVIEPLLDGQLAHAPFWEVHATRVEQL